jgi:hypothetical protein
MSLQSHPSRVALALLSLSLALLTGLAAVVHAEDPAPRVLEPRPGETLLITPLSQANPPFVLIFTPVEGANSYVAEISGDGAYQIEITKFTLGEVVVAALVLPPETAGGAYTLRVQGRNAADQPIGSPSDPVTFHLIETAPSQFAPASNVQVSGTILASSVNIPASVTVSASGDLEILSLGPVVINGTIAGKNGASAGVDGADIALTSASGITVAGTIRGGNGAGGKSTVVVAPPGQTATAAGGGAGNGGAVTLLANASNISILASARITTGRGGTGGAATAQGGNATQVGQKGGFASATGGGGGNGGDLAIFTPGGALSVAQVRSLLTVSGGNLGGSVTAVGGNGGPGSSSALPGPGGGYETVSGQGGGSGNLSLTTMDWNGDGVVTQAEFDVIAGGTGASAGASSGTAGADGQDPPAVMALTAATPCDRGEGQTPDTVKDTPKKAGDGWKNPGFGKPASATGKNGIGSGKGGGAYARGGDGGNLKNFGLSYDFFGLQWGLAFVSAGNGGNAVAVGGMGGPNGGDGGEALAEGGNGGSGAPAIGPDQYGGHGGDARAFGGDGKKAPACCTPPGQGLIGGKGGLAEAVGGDGGGANNTGGNGGHAGATGGPAGDGGDGCPPGEGGAGGVANVTPGAAGTGTLFNGNAGTVLFDNDRPNGAKGADCCDKTPPRCEWLASNGVLSVTVQDTSSGLKSIRVTSETNTNLDQGNMVTGFTVGQTEPFDFTVHRSPDPLSRAYIMFEVKDVAGNSKSCDPVVTMAIRERGKPVTETIPDVPQQEGLVTIYNGTPGLENLSIEVNGSKLKITGLRDGEQRTIDISSAMLPGDKNVIKLTAFGKPGGSATVMIHD